MIRIFDKKKRGTNAPLLDEIILLYQLKKICPQF